MKMSSKNNPLVSIIIPIYNSERYLRACLDSVFSQSYPNIEVLLVNDGSTDKSLAIIDEYAQINSNSVIITQKNGGLSSARNAGIKKAKGELLCFLDSDDEISPNFIKELIRSIDIKNGVLISCCRYTRQRDKLTNTHDNQLNTIIDSKQYLIQTYYQNDANLYSVTVGTKIFAAQLFKNVQFPIGKLYEDFAIIDRLILQSPKVALVDENLYYYRRSDNSITTEDFNPRHLDMLHHCDDLLQKYQQDTELYRALQVMKYTRCIEILTKATEAHSTQPIETAPWDYIVKNRKAISQNNAIRKSLKLSAYISCFGKNALVKSNILRRKITKIFN